MSPELGSEQHAIIDRMITGSEAAKTAGEIEKAKLAKAKLLIDLPTDASCTARDGAQLVKVLDALKAELTTCDAEPDREGEACFKMLGRGQERTHWLLQQLGELPMPTTTDEMGLVAMFEITGREYTCCSCVANRSAVCSEVIRNIDAAKARIVAWAKTNGSRNDDNCSMSTRQIREFYKK